MKKYSSKSSFGLVLASVVLSSQITWAQSTPEVSTQTTTVKTSVPNDKKISVLLDGASVLLQGVGVKATFAATDSLSIGGLVQNYTLKSDSLSNAFGTTFKDKVTSYGIIVDYFPINSATKGGLYVSGALVQSKVKSTVEDDYFGNDSAEDSATGLQVKVGYQFVIDLGPSDIVFQTGLGYGSAGKVTTSFGSSSGAKASIEPGLLLDLSGGVKF